MKESLMKVRKNKYEFNTSVYRIYLQYRRKVIKYLIH